MSIRNFLARLRAKRVQARHMRMKRAYGPLFDEVSAILFEADPVRINFGNNFGNNTDEYDPETGTILPRLRICDAWRRYKSGHTF